MSDEGSRKELLDPTFVVMGLVVLLLGGIAALVGYCTEQQMVSQHRPFANASLHSGAVYVTGRTWPIVERISQRPHLRLLLQTATGIELKAEFGQHLKPNAEVTILIHGFSAPEKELVSYFSDVVVGLEAGKHTGTTVIYDWPSTATRFDIVADTELRALNSDRQHRGGIAHLFRAREIGGEATKYAADRDKAHREGAPGLVRLISLVREHIRPAKINIMAHSMGSCVLVEAIRKSPELMRGMHQIVLLAPDLPMHVLEEPQVKDVIASTAYLHVYHSRNDAILQLSELANRQKSLGREGPTQASLFGNIVVHDMTEKLGQQDVHGKYLSPVIASEILAATVLAR